MDVIAHRRPAGRRLSFNRSLAVQKTAAGAARWTFAHREMLRISDIARANADPKARRFCRVPSRNFISPRAGSGQCALAQTVGANSRCLLLEDS
jgi:hypothetical protein